MLRFVLVGMWSSSNLQLLEAQKLLLPLTTKRELEGNLSAVQETWSRLAYPAQQRPPARPRLQSLSLILFLVIAISTVSILAWLSICKALRNREQGLGLSRRRLSQGGEGIDEDALSVIEVCLELESELGIMEQRASSSSENDSSERILELASALSEAAAWKEAEGQPRVSVFLEEQSGVESKGGEVVHRNTGASSPYVELDLPTGLSPALDPDSWMDAIPSIDLQPHEQETAYLFLATADESRTEQASAPFPSQRERARGRRDLQPCGILKHPYVRLPKLEEGVVPRTIDLAALFHEGGRHLSPHTYLVTMRTLFLQETLGQKDADLLMHAVERLVTTSWHHTQRQRKRRFPVQRVGVLGTYFMVLDSLVCAFELLGSYMRLPLWWGKFIAMYDTAELAPGIDVRGGEVADFHRMLQRRLIAALDTLKQGRRISPQELVVLKMQLFCSPFGQHQLKGPKWEPWRQDGACS